MWLFSFLHFKCSCQAPSGNSLLFYCAIFCICLGRERVVNNGNWKPKPGRNASESKDAACSCCSKLSMELCNFLVRFLHTTRVCKDPIFIKFMIGVEKYIYSFSSLCFCWKNSCNVRKTALKFECSRNMRGISNFSHDFSFQCCHMFILWVWPSYIACI